MSDPVEIHPGIHDGYYHEDAATFGDRLAAGRQALNLTQKALCRKLGIKLTTLQHWEDDLSEPRANKLQMLAGLLNVSIIWLLTGEGEGIEGPVYMESETPPQLSGIYDEFKSVRVDFQRLNDRLARLEKKLRLSLNT